MQITMLAQKYVDWLETKLLSMIYKQTKKDFHKCSHQNKYIYKKYLHQNIKQNQHHKSISYHLTTHLHL